MSYPLVQLDVIVNSKVQSSVIPEEILQSNFEQRLRWNIEMVTKEGPEAGVVTSLYEYNEAVFLNKPRDFVEENKEAIKANPLSFSPKMLNGYYLE